MKSYKVSIVTSMIVMSGSMLYALNSPWYGLQGKKRFDAQQAATSQRLAEKSKLEQQAIAAKRPPIQAKNVRLVEKRMAEENDARQGKLMRQRMVEQDARAYDQMLLEQFIPESTVTPNAPVSPWRSLRLPRWGETSRAKDYTEAYDKQWQYSASPEILEQWKPGRVDNILPQRSWRDYLRDSSGLKSDLYRVRRYGSSYIPSWESLKRNSGNVSPALTEAQLLEKQRIEDQALAIQLQQEYAQSFVQQSQENAQKAEQARQQRIKNLERFGYVASNSPWYGLQGRQRFDAQQTATSQRLAKKRKSENRRLAEENDAREGKLMRQRMAAQDARAYDQMRLEQFIPESTVTPNAPVSPWRSLRLPRWGETSRAKDYTEAYDKQWQYSASPEILEQ